jgi:hypothetical protein
VEGVVHALRRLHQSLREHGVLLDIHPQPEDNRLEVWHGDQVTIIGDIDQRQDIREVLEARAILDTLESDGLFNTLERRFFDLLEHYPNVDEWLDRWRRKGWTFDVPDELLETARELVAHDKARLIIRERVRVSTLKRMSA